MPISRRSYPNRTVKAVAEQAGQTAELDQIVAACKQTDAALPSSTNWRIPGPLRFVWRSFSE